MRTSVNGSALRALDPQFPGELGAERHLGVCEGLFLAEGGALIATLGIGLVQAQSAAREERF